MKTFSNRSNAARDARKTLGGDAMLNVDFHIIPAGKKFAWAAGRGGDVPAPADAPMVALAPPEATFIVDLPPPPTSTPAEIEARREERRQRIATEKVEGKNHGRMRKIRALADAEAAGADGKNGLQKAAGAWYADLPGAEPHSPQTIKRLAEDGFLQFWGDTCAHITDRGQSHLQYQREWLASGGHKPRPPRETKAEKALAMMRRPEGVTGPDLQAELGWLPHTVRGFISGHVRKKLGLEVATETIRHVGPNKVGAKGSFTRYRIATEA